MATTEFTQALWDDGWEELALPSDDSLGEISQLPYPISLRMAVLLLKQYPHRFDDVSSAVVDAISADSVEPEFILECYGLCITIFNSTVGVIPFTYHQLVFEFLSTSFARVKALCKQPTYKTELESLYSQLGKLFVSFIALDIPVGILVQGLADMANKSHDTFLIDRVWISIHSIIQETPGSTVVYPLVHSTSKTIRNCAKLKRARFIWNQLIKLIPHIPPEPLKDCIATVHDIMMATSHLFALARQHRESNKLIRSLLNPTKLLVSQLLSRFPTCTTDTILNDLELSLKHPTDMLTSVILRLFPCQLSHDSINCLLHACSVPNPSLLQDVDVLTHILCNVWLSSATVPIFNLIELRILEFLSSESYFQQSLAVSAWSSFICGCHIDSTCATHHIEFLISSAESDNGVLSQFQERCIRILAMVVNSVQVPLARRNAILEAVCSTQTVASGLLISLLSSESYSLCVFSRTSNSISKLYATLEKQPEWSSTQWASFLLASHALVKAELTPYRVKVALKDMLRLLPIHQSSLVGSLYIQLLAIIYATVPDDVSMSILTLIEPYLHIPIFHDDILRLLVLGGKHMTTKALSIIDTIRSDRTYRKSILNSSCCNANGKKLQSLRHMNENCWAQLDSLKWEEELLCRLQQLNKDFDCILPLIERQGIEGVPNDLLMRLKTKSALAVQYFV